MYRKTNTMHKKFLLILIKNNSPIFILQISCIPSFVQSNSNTGEREASSKTKNSFLFLGVYVVFWWSKTTQ